MHLSCKVYPRERSFIAGLSGNKRIEAPTEVILNHKEYDLCRKQGTITVNTNSGEKDVSTLSFADALEIATSKLVEETKESSVNKKPEKAETPIAHTQKQVFSKPVVEEKPIEKIEVEQVEEETEDTVVEEKETAIVEDNPVEVETEEAKVEVRTNFNNSQYKNKQSKKHKNNQDNR